MQKIMSIRNALPDELKYFEDTVGNLPILPTTILFQERDMSPYIIYHDKNEQFERNYNCYIKIPVDEFIKLKDSQDFYYTFKNSRFLVIDNF